MKVHPLVSCLALGVFALLAQDAMAALIPTNFGVGADAEVRESNPTQNRGDSTEIASRIKDQFPLGNENDGSDRNSVIYLKFDLSEQSMQSDYSTALRLYYRNSNLNPSRVHDTQTPNLENRTGMIFFGLDPDHDGNNWQEDTITYVNAPGLTPDGNVGTKDYDTSDGALIPLGTKSFPVVPPQNHLPVGGLFEFTGEKLDEFIGDAIDAGKQTVTIIAGVQHDGKNPVSDWLNFNYLFNPKEQTTLNDDSSYDPDGNGAVGSPWSGADNSTGAFSPTLRVTIPEPSAIGLLALGAGALALARRRR